MQYLPRQRSRENEIQNILLLRKARLQGKVVILRRSKLPLQLQLTSSCAAVRPLRLAQPQCSAPLFLQTNMPAFI